MWIISLLCTSRIELLICRYLGQCQNILYLSWIQHIHSGYKRYFFLLFIVEQKSQRSFFLNILNKLPSLKFWCQLSEPWLAIYSNNLLFMVFWLTSKKVNVNLQNLLLFILSSHFYKLQKRITEVKIWQQKTEEFSHLNPIRCLHNLVKMKLGGHMFISDGPHVALGPQVWQPWCWLHFQKETDVFQALNITHVQK